MWSVVEWFVMMLAFCWQLLLLGCSSGEWDAGKTFARDGEECDLSLSMVTAGHLISPFSIMSPCLHLPWNSATVMRWWSNPWKWWSIFLQVGVFRGKRIVVKLTEMLMSATDTLASGERTLAPTFLSKTKPQQRSFSLGGKAYNAASGCCFGKRSQWLLLDWSYPPHLEDMLFWLLWCWYRSMALFFLLLCN